MLCSSETDAQDMCSNHSRAEGRINSFSGSGRSTGLTSRYSIPSSWRSRFLTSFFCRFVFCSFFPVDHLGATAPSSERLFRPRNHRQIYPRPSRRSVYSYSRLDAFAVLAHHCWRTTAVFPADRFVCYECHFGEDYHCEKWCCEE